MNRIIKSLLALAPILLAINSYSQDSLFGPPVNYAVRAEPWCVFSADFDDGDYELAGPGADVAQEEDLVFIFKEIATIPSTITIPKPFLLVNPTRARCLRGVQNET